MGTATNRATTAKIPVIDRRQDRRLWTLAGIQVKRTDGSGNQYPGVCTDISHDGFGANVSAVLAVGEVVQVQFQNSDVWHRARVQYRTREHYGFHLLQDN